MEQISIGYEWIMLVMEIVRGADMASRLAR